MCCSLVFFTFPYGVLGQVWYLIVSVSDLCLLSYFVTVPRRCFFVDPLVIYVSCLSLLCYIFYLLQHGKGLTSWLSCVLCLIVFLSLSHIVIQVRCGS